MIDQVISLFAGTQGYLDDLPPKQIATFEHQLLESVRDRHPDIRTEIQETGTLSKTSAEALKKVIGNLKDVFGPEE